MEKWVDVKGYEGIYQISNYGRVMSVRRNKVLNVKPTNTGYIIYGLWKKNRREVFRAHRLVGEHFIGNPKQLPIVDHIDGNRSNNHVSNLRWVNDSDNVLNKHDNSEHAVSGFVEYSEDEISNEIWVDATKILPELNGKDIFMVSNLGRIKVPKNGGDGKNHPVTPKLKTSKGRYVRTSVTHNGKVYYYNVHRLVARCFLGEIPDGYIVDHIDRNIHNPRLNNLQIITISDNNIRAVKPCDKGSNNGYASLTHDEVINILKDFNHNSISKKEIKKKYGIKFMVTLSRILNGETYKNEFKTFNNLVNETMN